MFTGIISAVGKVVDMSSTRSRVRTSNRSIRVSIEHPRGWNLKLGDSVNVNGICSTISRLTAKTFEIEYMPETLKLTTAPFLRKGALVNLERSLRLSDRLDGHIVQGHIDTTGNVLDIKRGASSVVIKIKFSASYKKFIAKKGSICVNGVSLTVVEVGVNWFNVSLVNYTLKHTNLQNLAKGDKVNLEVDMLARYLDALLASRKK